MTSIVGGCCAMEQEENNICELKKQLNDEFAVLGEIFYKDNYKNVGLNNKYSEQVKKIKEIFDKLNNIDEKILKDKGLKRCHNCGVEVPIESLFCNMCGNPFSTEDSISTINITPDICPHCGAALDEDSIFCSSCGKKII